jgi:predicted nuclease of predicted toxin-antitoxin system
VKLALDEHYSPAIANQLRARGHDVVAVAELPERRGLSDREHFDWARGSARVFVTEDVVDFLALFHDAIRRGQQPPGLLFTTAGTFPRSEAAIGIIVDALASFLDRHGDEDHPAGGIAWLERY